MSRFYPVFLNLHGLRSVVVGGGAVAEQKVLGLLEAGARVTVVGPEPSPRLRDLAGRGELELRQRLYRPGDLAGAFLAIAATDDGAVNRAVWAEAEARGVPLNAVDDLPHCTFIAPSVHRQGDVTVAVSTAGKSPALAVRLRERIARAVGPEYGVFAELLGELRAAVAARLPDTRARTELWYRIVDSDALELLRRGDRAGARRRIAELIDAAGAPGGAAPRTQPSGIVYLVGAGPGDPDLITVRGLKVLRSADVVVYDRLVPPDLLDRAAPRAERVFVGKRPRGHAVEQEQINALLIAAARSGRVVLFCHAPFAVVRPGRLPTGSPCRHLRCTDGAAAAEHLVHSLPRGGHASRLYDLAHRRHRGRIAETAACHRGRRRLDFDPPHRHARVRLRPHGRDDDVRRIRDV